MQPQGDSIWGNINLCVEIALNVYYICGERGEGVVVPKDHANEIFSEETIKAGEENGDYLYYPKGTHVPEIDALVRNFLEASASEQNTVEETFSEDNSQYEEEEDEYGEQVGYYR